VSTIVIPAEIVGRWQQAIRRQHYLEWLSFATYLRALSRLAVADMKFADANQLAFLARIAHQVAVDMEPELEVA